MKKALHYFLILFLLFNLSGCAPLIVGVAVGGITAYAVSRDTMQGETDKSYDSIWDAALRVARIRGTIVEEDSLKGCIELKAESSRVYINVIKLTPSANRLKVRARKYHFPNLTLAQDIFTKIIEEAR